MTRAFFLYLHHRVGEACGRFSVRYEDNGFVSVMAVVYLLKQSALGGRIQGRG